MSYSHSRTSSIADSVDTITRHSVGENGSGGSYAASPGGGTRITLSGSGEFGNGGGSGSGSITFARRHPEYYIDAADLHILAGRTLFRVHSYFFSRESPIFSKRLIPASPGDVREGTTDSDPVILEDVSAEEFEIFCWVFYNPQYSLYNAPLSQWRTILNLAHKWDFPQIKELVVRHLHMKPSSEFPLSHKLAMYERYEVDRKSVVPLYVELCVRETPLTLPESRVLGVESTCLVAAVRERVRALGGRGVREDDDVRSPGGWKSPLPEGVTEEDVYRTVEEELARMQEEKETVGGGVNPNWNSNTDLEWLELDNLSLRETRQSPSSPTLTSSPSRPSTIKLRNLGHGGTLGKRGGRVASSTTSIGQR